IVEQPHQFLHGGGVAAPDQLPLPQELLVGVLALGVGNGPAAGREKQQRGPKRGSHVGPYYRGAASFGNRPLISAGGPTPSFEPPPRSRSPAPAASRSARAAARPPGSTRTPAPPARPDSACPSARE